MSTPFPPPPASLPDFGYHWTTGKALAVPGALAQSGRAGR